MTDRVGITLLNGLRFGMILQLAIGPVDFLILNASASVGFFAGLQIMAAATLVDGLFILLSFVGISTVIDQPKIRIFFKIFGSFILIAFGLNLILGVFHISLLPKIAIFSELTAASPFINGLLLTASNPLTIVFWGSILSKQIIENNYSKRQLFLFAVGCVLATVIFLTFISILGTLLNSFLPERILNLLNALIGILLIFLGIKLLRD